MSSCDPAGEERSGVAAPPVRPSRGKLLLRCFLQGLKAGLSEGTGQTPPKKSGIKQTWDGFTNITCCCRRSTPGGDAAAALGVGVRVHAEPTVRPVPDPPGPPADGGAKVSEGGACMCVV